MSENYSVAFFTFERSCRVCASYPEAPYSMCVCVCVCVCVCMYMHVCDVHIYTLCVCVCSLC